MTESWITAFLNAVIEADQIEARHTQLSGAQAQGLPEWCLGGSTGSSAASPGGAASGTSSSVTCVQCDQPAVIPMMQPGYENLGDPLDAWWLCSQHRSSMRLILGTPGSPGRPEDPPHEQYVKRLRGPSHRLSAVRSQQPVPPSMPRPSAARPGAAGPAMPVVGP